MPDDDRGGNNGQLDFVLRTMQSNIDTLKRAVDDTTNLLRGFTPQQVAAFDLAGVPAAWNVLTQRAGSWPGIQGGSSSTPPLNPGGDVSTNSDPMVLIVYGAYGGFIPTISGTGLVPTTANNIITLGTSDTAVYMQCDFTYGGGLVSIIDAEITSTSSTIPPSTITSSGGGSGSGTLYQELFGVTITAPVGSGPYKVASAPAVGGSQNFGICLDPAGGSNDSILGPWGV